MSAFLDFAPGGFEQGVRFWSALTTYDVSPPRGDHGEFATLAPSDGSDYLRVQRLEDGPDGVHLDLHVAHPRASADHAIALGATEDMDLGHVVMRSPGGFTFCFVSHHVRTRPSPTKWPDGHVSLLDQVCLDIPPTAYDAECSFWSEITGWSVRSTSTPEFLALERPAGQPLRVLLQRLESEDGGPVRAHLDWATSDRQAETARHVECGARVLDRRQEWTVLADPNGRRYCVTDRDPTSGLLPG
jgi:hypothetical protein